MELIHNSIIIADKIKYCDDFFTRGKGLRFSKRIKKGEAVILAAENESQVETMIDMMFVFFPIDVLWLNTNKEVVDLKRKVRPFTPVVIPRQAAKYVVELPTGMAKGITIGDRVSFHLNE